jgi:hypothetical protein
MYVFMPHHQDAGQNHNINITNKSLKILAKFKYMRMPVINHNNVHEKTNS